MPETSPKLDVIERLAKVVSLVAIPVVIPLALAYYTAKFQEATQRESINRDYVQLAVSILKEKSTDVSPSLRNWAVDLLAQRSPTKFSGEVVGELKSGAATLPSVTLGSLVPSNPIRSQASAVSADGKTLALALPDSLVLRDAATGRSRKVPTAIPSPVSVDFSPDVKNVAVADQSGAIAVWSIPDMKEVARFRADLPLYTIRFLGSHRIEAAATSLTIYIFDSKGQVLDRFFMHPLPPGDVKVDEK